MGTVEETVDKVVDQFKKSVDVTAMSRGLLVVDENVQFLANALQAANIKVLIPRSGMLDDLIKTELLSNRILVTRNTKGFIYDASSYEYGIISLDKLKYIDHEPRTQQFNLSLEL